MSVFGLGPTELLIIMAIALLTWVPAIGIFRIARWAGYEPVIAALWAVGFVFPITSWFVPLGLGFIEWPRDRVAAKYPPPPPPPSTQAS